MHKNLSILGYADIWCSGTWSCCFKTSMVSNGQKGI